MIVSKPRVVQVLPTLSFGDAVGNDTLAIADILAAQAYRREIYAERVGPKIPPKTARNIGRLRHLSKKDILIYHASTGTKLNFDLPGFGGRQMMIYHNITPPEFFEGYSQEAFDLCKYGYEGIRYLADKVKYCIADSEYNRRELLKMGYTCPIDVCPVLIPFEDYEREPDHKVLERYSGDGCTNLLFVGRIAPNKKQEDIIRAFYCYRKYCNPKSRLFLVGSDAGMAAYRSSLDRYIWSLELEDAVVFPGHIRFDAILAYYRLADVFVCMSEHEGFCVPLLEAMHFGVPIVAYRSSAVPDTLGQGGLLLDEKTPELAAAAIDRLVKDEALRAAIRQGQALQLEKYRHENVSGLFLQCLNRFMEAE